jgi:hypothetical protein
VTAIWLVLVAGVLMWQADKWAAHFPRLGMAVLALGYGCLLGSVAVVLA